MTKSDTFFVLAVLVPGLLVLLLAVLVANAQSRLAHKQQSGGYVSDREHFNGLLADYTASSTDKALAALKHEYATGRIGIHELEARTLHIHQYGTDPGLKGLFEPLEERAMWETRAKAMASARALEQRMNHRHAGPANTGTTITWRNNKQLAEAIKWELDASGTPVRRDRDGHVTWRAIETDGRGRVTIAERVNELRDSQP